MFSEKQIIEIKQQLLEQLESSNIQDKEKIKGSIEAMNQQQLEEFLKKNKLIKNKEKCIFCSIVDNEIPSYKITENQEAVAVLEINPISKGHTIIIPKIHSGNSSELSFELAEKISKNISRAFNPKKIDIINSNLFGHEIINLIPVYKNENIHSKRQQAKPKELENIQEQIKRIEEPEEKMKKLKEKPKKEIITDKNFRLPKRIP